MEFSRQGYWGGLSRSPPGDLPNTEIEPVSPALQAGSLLSKAPGKPSHQGNANQKHNVISPYTCQNGYYEKEDK